MANLIRDKVMFETLSVTGLKDELAEKKSGSFRLFKGLNLKYLFYL